MDLLKRLENSALLDLNPVVLVFEILSPMIAIAVVLAFIPDTAAYNDPIISYLLSFVKQVKVYPRDFSLQLSLLIILITFPTGIFWFPTNK